MTRDDKIIQAAGAYEARLLEQGYATPFASSMSDAFDEAVRWADENPKEPTRK